MHKQADSCSHAHVYLLHMHIYMCGCMHMCTHTHSTTHSWLVGLVWEGVRLVGNVGPTRRVLQHDVTDLTDTHSECLWATRHGHSPLRGVGESLPSHLGSKTGDCDHKKTNGQHTELEGPTLFACSL